LSFTDEQASSDIIALLVQIITNKSKLFLDNIFYKQSLKERFYIGVNDN